MQKHINWYLLQPSVGGFRYYYKRIYNLKNKFWRNAWAKFGALCGLIKRCGFQLQGAIHSHCLLWTEMAIPKLILESFICTDNTDYEKEPILYNLVIKFRIHTCKSHICGGPGRYGKCSKGIPIDPSPTTYHQLGNPRCRPLVILSLWVPNCILDQEIFRDLFWAKVILACKDGSCRVFALLSWIWTVLTYFALGILHRIATINDTLGRQRRLVMLKLKIR